MLHSGPSKREIPQRKSTLTASKLDIYCMAIGGTGMAPLACLLQEQGHRVRGTDGPLYPPMSTLLERAGIHPCVGYDPAHLEPRPDLVIIGNAIHPSHIPDDSDELRLLREFLAGAWGEPHSDARRSTASPRCGPRQAERARPPRRS